MTLATLPATVDEITDEWLTEALRRSARIRADEAVHIEACEALAEGTSFATRMYRLRLSGTGGVPASAILKLPVTGAVRVFIDGISAYAREVTFYAELAGTVPIHVPDCYVAEQATGSTDFVLLIEDLAGATPGDSLTGLTAAQAEHAAEALARFHAWGWEHARLATLPAFPRLDGDVGRHTCALIGQMFAQAWPVVAVAYGPGPELVAFGERLPELMPWFIGQLTTPCTIAHGELRADNLFHTDTGLILIDFQTVCQQNGMVDVSYLLSQSVPTEIRREHEERLVRRYLDALAVAGVSGYPVDAALRQYRIGVAFNLVWACLMHGQLERLDARGTALVDAMLTRAFAAIADNQSLTLIP
jgi:hypothetical protein